MINGPEKMEIDLSDETWKRPHDYEDDEEFFGQGDGGDRRLEVVIQYPTLRSEAELKLMDKNILESGNRKDKRGDKKEPREGQMEDEERSEHGKRGDHEGREERKDRKDRQGGRKRKYENNEGPTPYYISEEDHMKLCFFDLIGCVLLILQGMQGLKLVKQNTYEDSRKVMKKMKWIIFGYLLLNVIKLFIAFKAIASAILEVVNEVDE
jgi:hypothetical protein